MAIFIKGIILSSFILTTYIIYKEDIYTSSKVLKRVKNYLNYIKGF